MKFIPVAFDDSGRIYQEFAKQYIQHKKGLFVLAPSGTGKTYYCKNQAEPHWIDGDELWVATKAHPDGAWWTKGIEVINRIDQRCDVIAMEAKAEGFWLMGASNYWLQPDAIVIPEWETHKANIKHRETHDYDGGATSDTLDQVQGHVEAIVKWHTGKDAPLFRSINEAVIALTEPVR